MRESVFLLLRWLPQQEASAEREQRETPVQMPRQVLRRERKETRVMDASTTMTVWTEAGVWTEIVSPLIPLNRLTLTPAVEKVYSHSSKEGGHLSMHS